MKPNGFDVMKRVAEKNDGDAIQLAPLNQMLRAQYGKAGTQITMGVPGNVVAGLLKGEFLGGLILVRKEAWRAAEAELASSTEEAR